jgi:hypothetical protein
MGRGCNVHWILSSYKYQSKYRPFCFTPLGSFQADTSILEACESADCLLTALWFHTVTSYTNLNTFWNVWNKSKIFSSFPPKNLFHGKKYTPFWLRIQTIQHNTEYHLSESSTLADKILNHE